MAEVCGGESGELAGEADEVTTTAAVFVGGVVAKEGIGVETAGVEGSTEVVDEEEVVEAAGGKLLVTKGGVDNGAVESCSKSAD